MVDQKFTGNDILTFNKICLNHNITWHDGGPIDLEDIVVRANKKEDCEFVYWVPEWKFGLEFNFIPEDCEDLVTSLSHWHKEVDKDNCLEDYLANNHKEPLSGEETKLFDQIYDDTISNLKNFGDKLNKWCQGLKD